MRCDLHIHSLYSDGTDAPQTIVNRAAQVGLDCISFTEHDSLFGLNLDSTELNSYAASKGVEIIRGVELSARDYETNVKTHILAYWPENGSFSYSNIKPLIAHTRSMRNNIARKQIEQLNHLGLKLNYDDIYSRTNDGQIFKAHVYQAIYKLCKYDDEIQKYFSLFKRDQCCYFYKDYPPTQDIFRAIQKDGGISFLAHPFYSNNVNQVDRYVKMGLQGIEYIHPTQGKSEMQHIINVAQRYSLTLSGGSDYHGSDYRSGKLGQYYIDDKIAINFYDRLRSIQ